MFEEALLKDVLTKYKEGFVDTRWSNEKFKWEAVKTFQDFWNVNANDFPEMLKLALSKTFNLLSSMNNFPAKMIIGFAKADTEEVRSMFINLFDETEDIYERINAFKMKSKVLLDKHGDGAGQHYQNENAITTYLWLRYPDKYYIYKYSEVKVVAKELASNYHFKKGTFEENIRNYLSLYDEINEHLKQNDELVKLLKSKLTASCYPDSELKTLTIDVAFYISREYKKHDEGLLSIWFPEDYTPGLTADDWEGLLNDTEVFNESSLQIMKRLKDYGGIATCTELAVRYGELKNFYNSGSSALARRVAKKTGCPVYQTDNEKMKWWPILYIGRKADKDEEGNFVWKIRDELSEALDRVNLKDVELDATPITDKDQQRFWWLNANPKIWSYSDIAVGDVQTYTLYNENENKRRIFKNFLDVKPGDLIIGYEANPVKKIVAIAKITAAQDGEKIYFEKLEGLSSPIDYEVIKECQELQQMEFLLNPNGSLFKLTKGEYGFILDLIREDNPLVEKEVNEKYTKENFLKDVYMKKDQYDNLVAVLKNKLNIIFQGAPGVGKTFAAKRLAYSIMGVKDENRIEFVQFHQNYSYEDFVMGYKPVDDGFELKYGIFYRFCQKAANQPNKDFFFIIDEINRGNISKILGELLMLIECGYRGEKATLAYNGLNFFVPKNLHIIGMMNTADRSLAMIDYALRRRFSFFQMEPAFTSAGFIKHQKTLDNKLFDELVGKVIKLNEEITNDNSLGKGFCIGHSYFCENGIYSDERIRSVIKYDILPMLNEYWFDDDKKFKKWEDIFEAFLNETE